MTYDEAIQLIDKHLSKDADPMMKNAYDAGYLRARMAVMICQLDELKDYDVYITEAIDKIIRV